MTSNINHMPITIVIDVVPSVNARACAPCPDKVCHRHPTSSLIAKPRRVEGKTRYDYVPKDKVDLAKVLVGRHAKLYRARPRIQEINRDLNGIFDQIVELNRIEFPKKTEKGEKETDGGPTGS